MNYLVKISFFLIIVVFSVTNMKGQWKINKISVAVENGIKGDFGNLRGNDSGYFLPPQKLIPLIGFIGTQYYYGGNINAFFKNKYMVNIGIYSHELTGYVGVYVPSQNLLVLPIIMKLPYTRFTLGVGRYLKLNKSLRYLPQLNLSYVPTDEWIGDESLGTDTEIGVDYYYYAENYYMTNNVLLLDIKNTLQWEFNKYITFNFGIDYSQGLRLTHKSFNYFTMNSEPDRIYKGEYNSRASYSTLFLGIECRLWHDKE